VADARELKGKTMRDLLGYKPDIVMGGPPCDDYTTLGKRRGTSGEKGPLIFEFLRLVDELRPTAFVFENVPNLTRQFKAGFAQFLSNAAEIGYSTKWSLLKACDYGAPTLRTRVFVIGWHGHENLFAFRFPKATHGISTDAELPLDDDSSLKPYLFTNDVLADLPDVSKANTSVFPNHTGRTHKAETIEQIRSIKPGTSTGKSYRYRAPWAGLTQSLTAGLDNNTKSYIHPRYHREMSVREYARLHLFPDTWVFMGTQSNGLKQVANSVPIPLGNAVLSAVFRFLEESPASLPVNVKL
jgi:DNA (cytosine-5)-methyltransferase 1